MIIIVDDFVNIKMLRTWLSWFKKVHVYVNSQNQNEVITFYKPTVIIDTSVHLHCKNIMLSLWQEKKNN